MHQAQHRKNRQSRPVYWKAKFLRLQEAKHATNLHLPAETEKHRIQRIQGNSIQNKSLRSKKTGQEL